MYLALKTAHIFSVILFLGNVITGIFWVAHANRSSDPRIISHAMSGVIRSDALFTIPAVIAILVTGITLASLGGIPLLHTPWIGGSLIAFGLSGLLFAFSLAALQRRIVAEANTFPNADEWPSESYRRMLRQWEIIGLIAILLPLIAVVLMVFKSSGIL